MNEWSAVLHFNEVEEEDCEYLKRLITVSCRQYLKTFLFACYLYFCDTVAQ